MSAPIANRQSPIANRDDWLPIDEAARLVGEPLRTLQWRAGSQWVKAGLARIQPSRSGKGKPIWWIHRSAHPKLGRCPDRPTRDDRVRESLLARFSDHHVQRAYRKNYWLQEWRRRCGFPRTDGQTESTIAADLVAEARRVEDDGSKISFRSLQAWWKAYNETGPDAQIRGIEALVDQYSSREPLKPDGESPTIGRSGDAVAFFRSLYRTENKLTIRECHEFTLDAARLQDWQWPRSYAATARWFARYDDRSTSFLMRYGKRAWSHRFMSYLERSWEDVAPGEVFIADHHQCDFWVIHRGKQLRPWLTAVEDGRTRCIVGWHLGPSPHQDAILAALLPAFRDWAIPRVLHVDNGKDFTAKRITGLTKAEMRRLRAEYGREWKSLVRREKSRVVCDDSRWLGIVPELGIELTFALPYSPWSKPIERWFRTFSEQCARLFVTYCGNSAENKPECLDEIRRGNDVPTLEYAGEQVGLYLERYHHRSHRGQGMKGRSPLDVWSTATSLRHADDDALAFILSIRGSYKVGGNGVSVVLDGGRIGYGAKSAALRRYAGRKVLIAVDAHLPALCFALDADTRRLIARLEPNERLHPMATHEDVREVIAEAQRAKGPGLKKARHASATRTQTMVQRASALARRRNIELRATGTEDAGPRADIVPVQTGFESISKAVGTVSSPRRDRKSADLAAAAAALSYGHELSAPKESDRPRATLDMLGPVPVLDNDSPEDEGAKEGGTDADGPRPDLLSLVAGDRHDG